MKIGDKVNFENEVYEIIYIYESGYCEIKKSTGWQIQLVKHTDVLIAENDRKKQAF